ncbi:hypothetical protein RN001_008424 [Aquatica leii]|uniref:Uncharacterized protein n=1 Tax=Aquatica leii TaxID=1421715 RepID=A0AAN7QJ01_9COLE|nr:hypothetical protein RN001_008424 [Aquatica leii]
MVAKFVILFIVIPILSCIGNSEPVDFHPEDPCNAVGGQCIMKDECPTPIEYLNHCPQQQNDGAECCHGVSIKEYRCRRFGGECRNDNSRCPELLKRKQATDCPTGTFCCVLV